MTNFIITEEQKEDVLRFYRSRAYGSLRNLLNQLREEVYEDFFEKIKTLVRNTGKSSMVSIEDIEKMIAGVRR